MQKCPLFRQVAASYWIILKIPDNVILDLSIYVQIGFSFGRQRKYRHVNSQKSANMANKLNSLKAHFQGILSNFPIVLHCLVFLISCLIVDMLNHINVLKIVFLIEPV